MQINTSPILNLSTEFEKEVFEKEPLGISEHHKKFSLTKVIILLKMKTFMQRFKNVWRLKIINIVYI